VLKRRLRVAMIHLSELRLDSRVQRQARALAERGDEVDLVCIGAREQLRLGDGTLRTHPVAVAKAHGGAPSYLRGYASFTAQALARVALLDRERRFDVVQAHNMPNLIVAAALAPRLRGAPLILDVHDTFPELFATKFARPPRDPLAHVLRWEERLSAALATRVIVVTEQARQRLESRGVAVGRTAVVMNSPDERSFGAPRRPAPLPADGPIRVLYHGGLAERFGVATLIEAFGLLRERLPRLRLRICGAGEPCERSRLAALAGEIDRERIDVAREPVPFAQIPGELAAAHIGVVPTLHDRFTELLLPVKLLEYVHMGLAVVSARLPCIADYFSDAELHSFTPGDATDLAAAIAAVCARPSAARSRALRAGARLAPIAWERQRERYLAVVEDLASGPRRPPESALGGGPSSARRSPTSPATRSASSTIDSPFSSRG
jgi:glycosyltransferase involved in cell wall biosynthesis